MTKEEYRQEMEEYRPEFNKYILFPLFFEWRGSYDDANLEEDWKRFCDIPTSIRIKMVLEYKPNLKQTTTKSFWETELHQKPYRMSELQPIVDKLAADPANTVEVLLNKQLEADLAYLDTCKKQESN